MRRFALCSVLLGILVAGCDEKKPAPPETGKPTASATAAVTADAGGTAAADASTPPTAEVDGGKRDKRDKHMANCPTAVPGATVAIKDVEGGVEIAVTADDEATTRDVRERTKKLVEAMHKDADAGVVKHTGQGQGGGVYGRCTVVMKNTKLETAEIAKGTKLTVKAKDKSEIDWLRRETRDRDKEAKLPAASGAGAQRMAHCPSAVNGASTTVKDVKDGVVVTVIGKGDAVKDIRDRAKHTAEVAKKGDTAKLEHTGGGEGGGSLGRCPVVVEGETTVDVKEVEGGAELTVKAKDVAALQKETKARAANFH